VFPLWFTSGLVLRRGWDRWSFTIRLVLVLCRFGYVIILFCFVDLDKFSLWIVSSKDRDLYFGCLILVAVETYFCRGSSG